MKTRSVGRGPLVVLAASAAAVLLGGCGSVPPGAASVINGSTISRSDVNELAEAQCAGITKASTTGQQAQSTARRQLTQQALTLLMDIELNLQYGKAKDITPRPEEVAATYSQVDPLIKQLPEKYQSFMSDTFHRWAAGRDVITQAGEAATGQQATANNTDQLLQAGYQQRDPWLKKAEIDTDPRYGPSDVGWPGGSDPSVSKAVSSFARSAGKSQPDPAWVSALPASQKCG